MKARQRRTLLGFGIGGGVIAALCCFTPVLAALFGTAGVLGAASWLDPVLMVALIGFVSLTAFALSRRQSAKKAENISEQEHQ